MTIARCYEKGLYFSRKIVTWELQWIREGKIEEGRQGCFTKTRSWFNDEGVQLAVRQWVSGAGEAVTAHGLAKAFGDYLESKRATRAVEECLEASTRNDDEQTEMPSAGPSEMRRIRIRARTARRWLHKMGFGWTEVRKDVYVDGHEREDVVAYRRDVFIPRWQELQRRCVVFKEDGSWEMPPGTLLSCIIFR